MSSTPWRVFAVLLPLGLLAAWQLWPTETADPSGGPALDALAARLEALEAGRGRADWRARGPASGSQPVTGAAADDTVPVADPPQEPPPPPEPETAEEVAEHERVVRQRIDDWFSRQVDRLGRDSRLEEASAQAFASWELADGSSLESVRCADGSGCQLTFSHESFDAANKVRGGSHQLQPWARGGYVDAVSPERTVVTTLMDTAALDRLTRPVRDLSGV